MDLKEFKTFKVESNKSFRKDIIRAFRKSSVWVQALSLLMIFVTLGYITFLIMTFVPKARFKSDDKIEYKPTEITVDYNQSTMELDFNVDYISIKTEDGKYLQLDKKAIDNFMNAKMAFEDSDKDVKLNMFSIDLLGKTAAISYIDSMEEATAMRTVAIAPTEMVKGETSNLELTKVANRLYENVTSGSTVSVLDTYENYSVLYNDMSLSKDDKLAEPSLKNRLQSVENSLKYSNEDTQEDLVINLVGVGSIHTKDITGLRKAPGCYVDASNKVLTVYNYESDTPVMRITYVGQPYFLCNAEDLIETNIENLYIADGFEDKESSGYRTFALTSSEDAYVIRIEPTANEAVVKELLSQIGINLDDVQIKVVQESIELNASDEEVPAEENVEENTGEKSVETTTEN